MQIHHDKFELQSATRVTFHDITLKVRKFMTEAEVKQGIALVYSQHTTCSVLIQEQSDDVDLYGEQFLLQDLTKVLEQLVPRCNTQSQYLHPGPKHIEIAKNERNEESWWSLNTDAHLRSVLLGRSVTIPIVNGRLELGEFGVIYFADFDQVRARVRTVRLTIIGE